MATLGMFSFTDAMDAPTLEACVARLEEYGYDTVWIPEYVGREPFATAGYLLARTQTLRVASGIANIHVRDATAAAQAGHTLAELSGGRFILGLGVSHPALIEPRGHTFTSPLASMRAYLEGIAKAAPESPAPEQTVPIILAAHGPKMLELAGKAADGAKLYLMPPERVSFARELLGPAHELCVVLHCCWTKDATRAREVGREVLGFYLGLPAYYDIWRTCGFADRDFIGMGSDKLIDRLFVWGTENQIEKRIEEFAAAGASHVALAPFDPVEPLRDGKPTAWQLDWNLLEALAPQG